MILDWTSGANCETYQPAGAWVWGGVAGTAAAQSGGLDFTLPDNRTHLVVPQARTHFTLPGNRTHFTIPEED
jgi:hypothetical protein